MIKRRSISFAGTCAICALLLAACDSTSSEAPDSAAPEGADSEVAATSEPDTTVTEDAAPIATDAPVKTSGDAIRGPGGLEEKCLSRVASETGATVEGTNRIEESEAAIEIYVNVQGAQAPWKCLGYKDGSIAEVSYTGSEGAL